MCYINECVQMQVKWCWPFHLKWKILRHHLPFLHLCTLIYTKCFCSRWGWIKTLHPVVKSEFVKKRQCHHSAFPFRSCHMRSFCVNKILSIYMDLTPLMTGVLQCEKCSASCPGDNSPLSEGRGSTWKWPGRQQDATTGSGVQLHSPQLLLDYNYINLSTIWFPCMKNATAPSTAKLITCYFSDTVTR